MTLVAAGAGAVAARAGTANARVNKSPAAAAARHGLPDPAIEPEVCQSCVPPLIYQGGSVLLMNTAAGLTVTPIFWAPSSYAFPANYESIIDGYIKNVAAASGHTDNVFSVATEYYDKVNGNRNFITYKIKSGAPIVDTDPFPSGGCKPASGYSACVSDAQLRTELAHITSSRHLTTDLAHFYPVFFPPKTETQDRDGTTSAGDYCGYHRSFGSGTKQTIYSNEPFNSSSGCSKGQAPNGSVAADGAIDTLSHETMEAITDPLNPQYAWFDKSGNEVGDMCGSAYGKPLGHTSASDPQGSEYNQVINGGHYYTQSEFSNLAFSKLGYDKGCALSEALAQHPTAAGAGTQSATVATVVNDATPTTLAADGKSTAKISMGIADQNGNSVQGDHVHFTVGVQSGTGQCGTLSSYDRASNAQGNADVTYTASSDNVSCWILATEALGGRSAEAVVYQGTTRSRSPNFHAAFPTALDSGGTKTFTMTATNPSSQPVPATRVQFVIFPGQGATKTVDAKWVHLAYSTTGPRGTFTSVPLTGSTSNGNAIQGWVGPPQGTAIPANSHTTYTVRLGLSHNTPTSTAAPLVAPEGYLDQVNSASGSGATLGDTYEHQLTVPDAASTTNKWLYIGIGIGALALIAVIVGGVFRNRRKGHPQGPQAAATP